MTLKEKAEEYAIIAVKSLLNVAQWKPGDEWKREPTQFDYWSDINDAYLAGYKEALRWVYGFIGETWREDEKVPDIDIPVFKRAIEKELGE